MSELSQVANLIQTLGLPVAMLAVVTIGIWRLSTRLIERCFHPETGLVTVLVNRHIEFLDTLKHESRAQTETLGRMSQQLDRLTDGNAKILDRIGPTPAKGDEPWPRADTRRHDIRMAAGPAGDNPHG